MQETARDAVAKLFEDQAPRLWRALLASTGAPEIADEALDEAFAQLMARGEGVRSPERWVWKAAFKIAAGELKRRSDLVRAPETAVQGAPEEAVHLLAALAKVPSRQRTVLVLHAYAGYRTREIAQILGVSPATVRVQLSTARRRLRVILDEGDDDE